MSEQSKYIYGIIQEPERRRFQFRGLDDAEVFTINHENLAVVVSDTRLQQIDPTRKNVLAHTLVQDELLKRYALLPMGFGTVSASEDTVRKLLERNRESLIKEIRRLSGKIEAELKIFWDANAMTRENHQLLDKMKIEISSAPSPAEAQRLAIEAGKLVERIVGEWKARYADKVYNHLRELALDTRVNEPLGVKNILNASFLIDRTRESEFLERVRRLDAEYAGKLNFKYVGPLSPYNFVNVRLEAAN